MNGGRARRQGSGDAAPGWPTRARDAPLGWRYPSGWRAADGAARALALDYGQRRELVPTRLEFHDTEIVMAEQGAHVFNGFDKFALQEFAYAVIYRHICVSRLGEPWCERCDVPAIECPVNRARLAFLPSGSQRPGSSLMAWRAAGSDSYRKYELGPDAA
jgi:hypothetical protein